MNGCVQSYSHYQEETYPDTQSTTNVPRSGEAKMLFQCAICQYLNGYGSGRKKKAVNVDNKRNIKSADIVTEEAVQDNENFFLDISVCNCV